MSTCVYMWLYLSTCGDIYLSITIYIYLYMWLCGCNVWLCIEVALEDNWV